MPETNTIGVRMTMDASQYQQEMNRIRREMTAVTQEFSKATSTMTRWQDSIQGTQARIQALTDRIRLQEERVAAASARLETLRNSTTAHARSVEAQANQLEKFTTQLNRYRTQLNAAQENLEKLVTQEEYSNSVMGQLNSTYAEQQEQLRYLTMQYQNAVVNFGEFSQEAQNLRSQLNSLNAEMGETAENISAVKSIGEGATSGAVGVGTIFRGVFGANLAFGGITGALRSIQQVTREVVTEFIDFESAFTGVRKTVDGTEQDFNKLSNELKVLGTQLATPLDEIADIAAIAGQMGIAVEDISEFTRVMIQLGDSTNISAAEAGQSLAQLSNLLGLTADEYERMGSTIVELGNNYPTTEQDIVKLSQRLAGMAGQVSMTAADVLGLANALSSVGLEAEMGGNTISKTLRDMLTAVENGTEALSIYAQTANMTVDEFVELFQRDATGALTAFVRGLGRLSSEGRSATGVLAALGTTQTRQVDTLLRLAGNADLLAESVAVANGAWDDNIALAREAALRYETLESRIEMMKNAWRNVAIEIGTGLQPVMRNIVDMATDFANFLTGNQTASYELEQQFRNLTAALADYKEAQEEAAKATQDSTAALGFAQDTISLVNRMAEIGESVNDSWRYVNSQTTQYEAQLRSIAGAQENAINYANQLISGENFTSYGQLQTWFTDTYARGEADANWYLIKDYIDSVGALNDDLSSIGNNIANTYGNIIADAQNFAEALANGQLTDNMIENWLKNIRDEGSRSLMRAFIDAFSGMSGEGVTDAFVQSLDSFTNEQLQAMIDSYNEELRNMSLSGDFNVDLAATYYTAIGAIEAYMAKTKQAADDQNSLNEQLSMTVRTTDELRAQFERQQGETIQSNIVFGITGQTADQSEMKNYESYIGNLISAQFDYAEALGMTGASMEEVQALWAEWNTGQNQQDILSRLRLSDQMSSGMFDAILGNWVQSYEDLDNVSSEYFDRFGQWLEETGSFERILANYNAESEKIVANVQQFGDAYDRAEARLSLINSTLSQIYALSPEERDSELMQGFVQSLLQSRELLADEVAKTALSDADKLRQTYSTLLTQEINLQGLEGDLYDTGAQKVVSGAKSLLGQLLGIDRSTLTTAEQDELESAIDDIGRLISTYGTTTVEDSLKTVADVIAEFTRGIAENEALNMSMGITGADALNSEKSIYNSLFSNLIQLMFDYKEAIGLTDMELSDFIDLIDEWNASSDTSSIAERLGLDGSAVELMDELGKGMREIVAYSEEYAEKFSEVDDPLSRIRDSLGDIDNLIASLNLPGLSEELIEELEKQIVSKSKSLLWQLLGIDPENLTAEQKKEAEQLRRTLIANIGDFSSATEDKKSGNWWSNWLDENLVNEKTKEFGEGFEAMIGSLTSVWNNLGGTVLDTINMWLDAQIEAIERAMDELEDALERQENMLTYASNKRQAELNKQLEEGLITEEQYNLQSAQNKAWAEAEKLEAQEEYNQKREQLENELDELERKQFEQDKLNSIAQVWINAAQGISAAWATGIPWYAGVVTALIGAMAAAQTGIIASQQYTALAQGGVVTSPTMALVGEAGAEAVMPLENNTGWITELAEQISALMTTPQILGVVDRNTERESETSSRVSKTQNFTQIINSPKALSRIEIYRDTRKLFKQFGRTN